MTPLQRIVSENEEEILGEWSRGWPAAAPEHARVVLQRALSALRGESLAPSLVGLSVGALRGLRRAVLEAARTRGGTVDVAELFRLDDLFAGDIDAASSPSGVSALEAELVRVRGQLLGLVEQAPLAIALVEAPSGRTIIANRKNAEIFRLSAPAARDGVEHYGTFVGFAADGRELRPEEWPLVRAIRHGEVVEAEVIAVRRGDGSSGFIRVHASPIRDSAGNIISGAVLYDDVTQEEQTRAGLRLLAEAGQQLGVSLAQEEILSTLTRLAVPRLADWCAVEIANDDGTSEQVAVAHIDPARVAFAHQLRALYPPPPEGRGVQEVLKTGISVLTEHITDEMLVGSTVDAEHLRLVRALGLCSAMIVPIQADGRVFGALSAYSAESGRRYTNTDLLLTQEVANRAGLAIENARLYRRAQAAVRARDEFLSVASHELRTPLTALQLQVSALLDKTAAGTTATLTPEKLKRLDAQVLRLRRLVEQLLDVSRLATGRLLLEPEDADLNDIAKDVVEQLLPAATAAGCALTLSTSGVTRGLWDAARIEQVVVNIVGNAIKYGAGKPVTVVVGGDGDHARLSVADGGVGIAVEDQTRIFGQFERAASARNFGGLGLGLWISRQIVSAHGGAITVDSAPGTGSTFVVQLPVRPPTPPVTDAG